jgi:hypothetical protein
MQSAAQQYNGARSDFVTAFEYMSKRGYDLHEFAYAYSASQHQVTAKDMQPRDMAEVQLRDHPTLRPAVY